MVRVLAMFLNRNLFRDKYQHYFVVDFNQCDLKALQNRPNRGNPYFMSVAVHMGASPTEYDDLQSLFYTMLVLADVELPWGDLTDRQEMMRCKQSTSDEVMFNVQKLSKYHQNNCLFSLSLSDTESLQKNQSSSHSSAMHRIFG